MTTPPHLAAQTCEARLDALGVSLDAQPAADGSASVQSFIAADLAPSTLDSRISWHGPAAAGRNRSWSEATVQAGSGLMHVHGRDWGGPARLGLEIASVAAGVLAAQGVLAALIGQSRGQRAATVETSVFQAGLLQASHYIAAATCAETWVPAPPQPDPGPPFASADGRWFEIETLDPDAWAEFWKRLGADVDLGLGWTLFRPRYFRGTCSLPPGFHQATRRHTLAELAKVSASCGVSFSPVRGYPEAWEARIGATVIRSWSRWEPGRRFSRRQELRGVGPRRPERRYRPSPLPASVCWRPPAACKARWPACSCRCSGRA